MTKEDATRAVEFFERISSPLASISKLACERYQWGGYSLVVGLRSTFAVNGEPILAESRFDYCQDQQTANGYFGDMLRNIAVRSMMVDETP